MTHYLELDDLLYLISEGLRQEPKSIVRDWGALESALHRPRSTVFGVDAYPALDEKAASLMHSLARDQPLLDGNKRLAWLATRLFYAYNSRDLRAADARKADAFVREVASGEHEVGQLAESLRFWVNELK
ncbi:death on curing protein [Saccharopolyspora antimicrobica]|uniref:Death on curing protein n=1 Tax=Saccharopolyspora antimicrobica TaxID=455193 RepID=A0A1I4VDB0_9PSEU|nr:Fic family protein [Saccharopolyspora antimicrobica]RKT86242.1 death-on-curing protein [Saccharopolyspora antimicrobica]SFM99158.1 death on curing protein [Saccharopolyspora antimicrobica]